MLARIAALLRMQPPVVDNRGLLFGSGADYPTLGSDGWQTGAIWCNTTGDTGTALYVNEGSVTSCNFVAIDTVAGASAGAIEFDDNTTGPLISIETTDPTNDSYTTPFIITGAYSSSADNALVLSATNNRPVSFLFEDSGDALGAADYRAGLFRVLLTVDQTNAITLNALRAQIKANNLVDITSASSVVAPLTGYLELDGAGARTLRGHVACVRAALETGAGAHTLGSRLAGFESTLNSSGTFTAASLFAYLANISGGTTTWQFGYKVADSSCDTGVGIGTCTTGIAMLGVLTTGVIMTGVTARAIDIVTSGVVRMGTEGVGIPLNNTYPYGFEVHNRTTTDFAQPATGVSAGIYARYEMGFDQVTATGHAAMFAKLRVKKDLADGVHSGVFGYVEISGVGTVIGGTATTQTNAGTFTVESDANFELSTGYLTGVCIDSSINSSATTTGTVLGLWIKRAGTSHPWDEGIRIDTNAATAGITIADGTTDGLVITGASRYAIDIATSGVIRMGVQDTGVDLVTAYPYAVEVHCEANADIAAASSSAGIYSRFAIEAAQTTQLNHIAVFAKLRVKANLGDGNHVGVYGLVEKSAGTTSGTATTLTAAGIFALDISTVNITTGHLNGICIDSSVAAGGTMNATMVGLRIKKSGANRAWPVGIWLENSATTTGISIGTCTTGIDFTGVMATAVGIEFTNATFDPNTARDNRAIEIGSRASEIALAFTGGDGAENFEPIQMNFNCTGTTPANISTVNIWQGGLFLDTHDLGNVRLKWSDLLTTVNFDCRDVYIHQAEIKFGNAACAVGAEVAVLGLVLDGGSGGVTCTGYRGVNITLRGAGTPANASGLYVRVESGATVTNGIELRAAGTMGTGIRLGNISGTECPTTLFTVPAAGSGVATASADAIGDVEGSIAIMVGATVKYIQYFPNVS